MSAVFNLTSHNLRPMTELDLDSVMDIELCVYPYPWTRGIFNDCIKVGYKCWVLEDDNDIIGYSVLSIAVDEAHLLNISIKSERQNEGLGRQFIEKMCELAKMSNADTILLEVRPSNLPAVHLYDSLGFNEVGVRKNYYPSSNGKREDALIMAKSLY
ncbi:Ribosomal-protein-S18p-alanine acetyltransferase [hydrothermal vent metagenome]|uniref:Ribosomal-protein-S18p-alanine acetyltransferase n=1 Tax=hydrothermal vent metagenome TaxID=652676 RepID=A0A3B0ZIP1_9ZZZZ